MGIKFYKAILLLITILFCCHQFAQGQAKPIVASVAFNTPKVFIENIGQYGSTYKTQESMGDILFGYEGHSMPILFTKKGLIFLQRKVEKLSKKEEEKLEKQGLSEEQIEHKKIVTDKAITMEWAGANSNVQIVKEEKTYDYHTYGLLTEKAYGYKKITYKNLYNGIDLIYHFTTQENNKIGFEYSLQVSARADVSQIKMRYGGDVKKIKINKQSILIINSDIEGIEQSVPISFYTTEGSGQNAVGNRQLVPIAIGSNQQQIPNSQFPIPNSKSTNQPINQSTNKLITDYKITNNDISFTFPQNYDNTKPITIDPFVSSTSNLDGLNAGKAKDVDFDYEGNVYVTGGGNVSPGNHRLAKYSAAGILQWTFSGVLTTPVWEFGDAFGGWVVEKPSGKIYLGQGLDINGFRVIRLNTNGIYDNYITISDLNFTENWKMNWSCSNGNPQILIFGGGASNVNIATITPPSTSLTTINITSIPFTAPVAPGAGVAQDIVDAIIDPSNKDLYSLFASQNGTPTLNNKLYKNAAPYSAFSIAWNTPSGFNTMDEADNRPYLLTNYIFGDLTDNSANMLALNQNYLFYWDGKNLKAFNKATGVGVGNPLIINTNTAKMSGGILADSNNNVYIGNTNGTISSYHFDGSSFSDNDIFGTPFDPGPISVAGYATKSVYDLAINEAENLLYVSGDGFVASYPTGPFTGSTPYVLTVTTNCITGTANSTLTPAPPAGTTVLYSLYQGSTFMASNSTGIFTGLSPAINYTIKATLNASCSGAQVSKDFIITAPAIVTTITNETCGNTQGQIVASASGTTAPYTYSINGTTFSASGTFTGLGSNTYTITVKDANGCTNIKQVTVGNNSFTPSFTTSYTGTNCGNSTGAINATANGGIAPYQYSLNNGTSYQASNIFTGLAAGQYQLKIKDVNGCLSTMVLVDITPSFGVGLTTTQTNTTCGLANGTITATNVGGAAPFTYSINAGASFQVSNIFTGLAAGTAYTIRIKDANGCINNSATNTLANTAGATVSGISTNSTCGFANGKITATAQNGTAPFQYSIDGGVTYQASNIFNNLLAANYTIAIKDGNNCVNNSAIIAVANTAGATVTGVPTNSTCGFANGKITATAQNGTAPFQYSIDGGVTYQASNIFNNLLAANYTIAIKDGNSCINNSVIITVANTAGATVSGVPTNSTCGFANGKITATANGGTAPFQYSIDGGVTYQISNIFTGLLASNYTVTIKDGNNCVNNSASITVANTVGAIVTGVSTNSTCGFANGKITATANGGTAPFQYSIDGGVTYQISNIFTGLLASNYTITIKDGNNCVNNSASITVANTVGATVTAISNNATCGYNNGKITATASGGSAPVEFSINGTTYQTGNVFTNLAPSAYTVFVKDANNCINTKSITVGNTPVPILNIFAGRDTDVVIRQPLQLNAIDVNNIGFVSYTWSPAYGLNRVDVKNPTAILDRDFAYEVVGTTADGCLATDSIKIKILYNSEIYVPTAFTPNGDGKNDFLRPKLIGIKELKYFSVYNRYGELIFKSTNENEGWNGQIKGIEQNSGSYVWIAEAVDYVGRIVFRKGSCLLVR